MKYRIDKGILGKQKIKFTCLQCKSKLNADLQEAGTRTLCPTPGCGATFVVPGEQERKAHLAAKEANKRPTLRDEKKEVATKAHRWDMAEAENQQTPSTPDFEPLPDLHTNGEASSVATPDVDMKTTGAVSENQTDLDISDWIEKSSVVNPPQDTGAPQLDVNSNVTRPFPSQPPEKPNWTPVDKKLSAKHSGKKKKWWRDSISLGDITKTRYPALMAYRNLMVLVWWVFTACVLLAMIFAPIVYGYGIISVHNAVNSRINNEQSRMYATGIQDALETAKSGQGLSAGDLATLRENLPFEYTSPVSLYGSSLAAQDATNFATHYQTWRKTREADLASQRSSLLTALTTIALGTIGAGLGLMIVAVIYTILLLVPPECIKLAIDVEQGIRSMAE